MRKWISGLLCWALTGVSACAVVRGQDDLPFVPEGFTVDVVAREPMVRNPCVMAFDRLGRICVGQGPQWRGPTPETPGDRVDLLIDDDDDGITDRVKTFAEGFNSIQGIAWHGNDLWVANAPDLTVVRDTDGDDEADVYVRVYTGLGNLEHCLHGLNFGPDGKLYMSKGNSKGYNRLDQLAPKAFRELWGLESPEGAPDYTEVEVFTKETYRRAYHTPQDDWGQQGGILRCDPYGRADDRSRTSPRVPTSLRDGANTDEMGRNLEIYARGFRNPWDIGFDDGFDWLGTDNDQTEGDKVFAPFYGSNFGWGHPWSFDWKGIDHLPTVPISMPLYEGSGTGVVHYNATQFPPEYRDVFFVNDWMRREVYLFRTEWQGALRRHAGGGFPTVFAHAGGGRSLPSSSGRVFEPTDIEVGPDGALYILSWGHGYGATLENDQQVDAGRVYRIRYAANPLIDWRASSGQTTRVNTVVPRRERTSDQRSFDALFADLGSSVPAWRVDAQNELLRRGSDSVASLKQRLGQPSSKSQQTWGLWTLGRLSVTDLLHVASQNHGQPNVRLQTLRILAQEDPQSLDDWLAWDAADARLRHATVQAVWQSKQVKWLNELVKLAARERDRIVYYSTWNALGDLMTADGLRELLNESRPRVRLGALLALLRDGQLTVDEVFALREDTDSEVAGLAAMWLEKTGSGDAKASSLPEASLAGTYRHRPFVDQLVTDSGRPYSIDWTGLAVGKRHYTDRDYRITDVPPELVGVPFLRTSNQDDRRLVERLVSFRSDSEMTLYIGVDVRAESPPAWMRVGRDDGFHDTEMEMITTDPTFRFYAKRTPAGLIHLGPNLNHPGDSPRGNYVVAFKRDVLTRPPGGHAVTIEQTLAAMPTADPDRGRELFLHPHGAGCFKCHRMQGIGNVLGPDLSDIGNRVQSPDVLIESIIHPSRVITEGFAQQNVLTTDGRVLSGSVLEETGQTIKLASSEGSVTTLSKDDVERRVGTKKSPMPDGFAEMMTAQQLADLAAWLMTQKVIGDREGFSFQENADALEVFYGKQRIASYLKNHPQLTRRALVNVTTPSGLPVTRHFPPRKPEDVDPGYQSEDGIIHPIMHAGLWLSFGDVNGNDYWRLKAGVAFDGFLVPPEGGRSSGSFVARNVFLPEDAERSSDSTPVLREITRYHFQRVPEGILLHIDAEYRSEDHDFYFGDQEESGLAVRVASPIRVQGGNGVIVNDRGEQNGAQVWGKQASWFDYSGTIDGREVGIMVLPDPGNPRPSWLHARDYGVVVTNPFPKQPKERREPYVKTWVKRGQSYRLSYAILIHDLPASEPLDRAKAAAALAQEFEKERELIE